MNADCLSADALQALMHTRTTKPRNSTSMWPGNWNPALEKIYAPVLSQTVASETT